MNLYVLSIAAAIVIAILAMVTPQSMGEESQVALKEQQYQMVFTRCIDQPQSCRGGNVGGY